MLWLNARSSMMACFPLNENVIIIIVTFESVCGFWWIARSPFREHRTVKIPQRKSVRAFCVCRWTLCGLRAASSFRNPTTRLADNDDAAGDAAGVDDVVRNDVADVLVYAAIHCRAGSV